MSVGREIHRTDRLAVTHVEADGGAYAIELPVDFAASYKVNAAHVHFYRPGVDDPLDSFELQFGGQRIEAVEGLELPDDSYAGCEYEVAYRYQPAVGLPYETVRETVTELEAVPELDGRVTARSTLSDAATVDRVDYRRIDVRDPETGEYVTGDVVRVADASDRTDAEQTLLASGSVRVFPAEFAGFEAEVALLADPA